MATRTPTSHPTDIALAVVWILGGVLLAAAGLLRLVPSVYALGGLTAVAGLLGLLAALTTRLNPAFWAAAVPGALLVVFAVLAVRFPTLEPRTLALLAAGAMLGNGIVRLVAAREFPGLWPTLVVAGLLSLVLGGLLVWEVIDPTTTGVALLLGFQLMIDGVTSWRIARA